MDYNVITQKSILTKTMLLVNRVHWDFIVKVNYVRTMFFIVWRIDYIVVPEV